ncbi:MAG: hypothetical protein J6X33_08050 [Clostridiales bacterium]|nr:hypothetical protein [Clostridiales bacterium]
MSDFLKREPTSDEIKAQKILDEYSDEQTVDEMRHEVDELKVLVHGMWLLLKAMGVEYDQLDAKLDIASKLEGRVDYSEDVKCPSCGRGLQTMEKYIFKKKCYYCGYERTQNPFQKYDSIDLNAKPAAIEAEEEQAKAEAEKAEQDEIFAAREVLNTTFEPYDVSKDLNFDEPEDGQN